MNIWILLNLIDVRLWSGLLYNASNGAGKVRHKSSECQWFQWPLASCSHHSHSHSLCVRLCQPWSLSSCVQYTMLPEDNTLVRYLWRMWHKTQRLLRTDDSQPHYLIQKFPEWNCKNEMNVGLSSEGAKCSHRTTERNVYLNFRRINIPIGAWERAMNKNRARNENTYRFV